jgi:quercetin dioxygenase-like cupin family protein
MKHLIRLFVGLLVPAFMVAGLVALPAMAQDKAKDAKAAKAEKGKAVQKVLHEDDKVRVTETTFKPGDVGPNVVRGFRVARLLSGGTLLRTWADGKTDKRELKTGQVIVAGPDKQAYFHKNIGKTNVVFYTVNIKGVK